MASAQSYSGPVSLGYSMYADPIQRKAALAASASASVAAVPNADTAMATKEQIAALKTGPVALDVAQHNADAQLAIFQGNVLKEEVAKHSKKFSRTVSNTITNTRRLLELIREASPEANNSITTQLWDELEQLFAAASEAKEALPVFLEKQRNNMSLYHSSLVNEAIKDTQDELNIQHKKINLQHNLILERQEAFLAYKEQTADKLKELEDLHERVSRLTLEKGNLRTEIDKYSQLLEEERSTKAGDRQKLTGLEKELETLVDSKKQLLAEVDTMRKAVQDLEAKMNSSEQEITDRFTTELKSTADLLAKETQKATALNAMISQLKGGESTARLDADKAKKENKVLNEKYANQAIEHAKAFTKLNEQIKHVEGLNIDLERHQKENAELRQRLTKLANLEDQITKLNREKSALSEQVSSLSTELDTVKKEKNKADTKVEGLLEKVADLEHEVEQLESAHKELLSKMKEDSMAVQTLELLKGENTKLKAVIDDLKASKNTSSAMVGFSSPKDQEAIEDQEKKIKDLETALREWTDLAKRSYKEYKDILPTYKKAEQFRQDIMVREATIKKLELELAEAKVSNTNGVGATTGGSDVRYWKQKYETLLLAIDN
ncbi:hypothetical protein ACET3X_002362 [Alternaria dauci]|uniref:Uncharacterized protein n=1 Tax=Alternaria dauci TaxID=48095 RepID=A0ABR3UPU3_9PLEO